MPALAPSTSIDRSVAAVTAIGALASAFKCVWFFGFFSHNLNRGVVGAITPLMLYLPLVITPYVLLWLAHRISRAGALKKAILVVAILCMVTSGIYYLDGLPKVQDGEFAFVFLLAVPQSLLALGCLVAALWLKWRQASNNTIERDARKSGARPSL